MTKNFGSGLRRGAGIAGLGAAAAALLGVMSTGAASADTFIPLPDGSKTGPNVPVTRTAESALSSPSLAANGAGRVAWVSGTVTADVSGLEEATDVTDANSTTNNAG